MAVRNCPHCMAEITAPETAARSNDIECSKCGTRLEVAPGSRTIATLAGLAAGAVAWQLSNGSPGDLGAVLPTLYAFLAFGIVSALVLMFTANLRNAPELPVPLPVHSTGSAGHGTSGHGGGQHRRPPEIGGAFRPRDSHLRQEGALPRGPATLLEALLSHAFASDTNR